MIVRASVVLNTMTDVSKNCAAVISRAKVSWITSVDGLRLWLLT